MNTLGAARVVRRLMLPIAALLALWIYLTVGFLRVPKGMDTMPETHPAGSMCLIDKRRSSVREGTVVFVDVQGGTLLSRVTERGEDFVRLAHDNRDSQLPSGDNLGAVPLARVRGVILAVFGPESDSGNLPDGR